MIKLNEIRGIVNYELNAYEQFVDLLKKDNIEFIRPDPDSIRKTWKMYFGYELSDFDVENLRTYLIKNDLTGDYND